MNGDKPLTPEQLIIDLHHSGHHRWAGIVEQLVYERNLNRTRWIGCGECDSSFQCFDGRKRCIRLPLE